MLAAPPPLPLQPFTCRLPKRSLLRIMGKDAHEFLQGLFTNDVHLLKPGGSQWGCFLYFPGRVMCDAYVYQAARVYEGQSSLLVEVHQDVKETLREHLLEMQMRKKVTIEDVSDSLTVAACLVQREGPEGAAAADGAEGGAVSSAASTTLSESLAESFLDPRSFALFPIASPPGRGPPWALMKRIVPSTWAPPAQPVFLSPSPATPRDGADDDANARAAAEAFRELPYDTLLIANGIAEGPQLFRDGKSLPFELNADFLSGVHFHKGCYIGQELTHRTHVMLVTRKRTVPLYLPVQDSGSAAPAEGVVGQGLFVKGGKEKVGEVTASVGPYALGLLRLRYVDKETRSIPDLTLKSGQPVLMHLPTWWPPKQIKKLLKNN